ncbi:MAG: hypothetical protein BWY19_00806 [bacterium ADurb.Bin212]|nr:MAG: hypothetical protein BWY19_00806 [bacterium ADurb.Bin212]
MNREFFVVLVKPKKKFVPFSWIIRLFQGWTKYSHCAFEFSISNHRMFYEAKQPEVSLRNEYFFKKQYEVIKRYKITVSEEKYRDIRDMVMLYSGSPYPVLENIALAFSKWLRLENNFYSDDKFMKCSELLANFLNKLFDQKINSEMVDVKDIENYLDFLAQQLESNVLLVELNQ